MDTITERDEYEMSLYGFSLKDFKRESKKFYIESLKHYLSNKFFRFSIFP